MRSLNVRPTLIPTLALAVWTLHAEDRDQEELSYWLSNMARHGYTTTEMQSVTGLDATGLEKSTFESTDATHASSDDTIIEVWPYPGGRHPRSGFLEGAIDPWRETKFSVFLPWDPNSYVVVDLPEALWDDGKLQFLAHTHIPTVWQEKGVELKRREWRRHANGRLTNRFYLPDGRVIRAEVSPTAAFVDMKLHFKNRSSRAIRGGRVQICVMLKGAAEFNAQTNNNKQFPPTGESSDGLTTNFTAVHSVDGNRSIVTLWTRMVKPWANSRCPCIHADPKFPDVEPGEEATLHGRLFFHEGPGLDEAIRQHRMELSRESTAPRTIEPRIVSNEVIWDRAHHNGASALVRFHDAWVCALREGKGDVSEDGVIRILTSTDDRRWQPHALLDSSNADLRDPKLAVTPSGQLMLSAQSALRQPAPVRSQTLAWRSADAGVWSAPLPIGSPNEHLWDPIVHGDRQFVVGYSAIGRGLTNLYTALDARSYNVVTADLSGPADLSETAITFLADGRALCVARRLGPRTAHIGYSPPPYNDWVWKDLMVQIGSPRLVALSDGHVALAGHFQQAPGGRKLAAITSLAVAWLDPESGKITRFLPFPSTDASSGSPGLVEHEGALWVTYARSDLDHARLFLGCIEI